jgi:hypothetical protein
MSREGRSTGRSVTAGALRPIARDPHIHTYRVADYPEIFSLYLNAFERIMQNPAQRTSVSADEGQPRRRAG